MHLSTGTRLGPYEILAPIGAGGMGEVYRGRDTRLGREVAIKVLPLAFARDAERLARFDREARAVSSLNHPHICILHDIGHQDGIDYLVMEHIGGETLYSRLAKGPLPLEQALRYSIEIAGALALAHRQGVCHRDLKPGNIMLTKAGTKLLDFGLARLRGPSPSQDRAADLTLPAASDELTQEGAILGTYQYMAPEQLEAKETDARTDIFAFGAVLHEMLTGRKAFEGKSQAGLIGAILQGQPRFDSADIEKEKGVKLLSSSH
jgi:serine/threonine protein kinase